MDSIIKKDSETDFAYKFRLIINKSLKEFPYSDLEWEDVRELLQTDQHRDTLRKRGDAWKELIEHIDEIELPTKKDNLNDEQLEKLNEKILELKKEKSKISDLNVYTNKKIRELARLEDIIDKFKESLEKDYGKQHIPNEIVEHIPNGRDAILMISDIHFGIEVDNNVNKYNEDIAKERLNKLIDETINRCEQSPIDKLHVVILGDSISGLIHNTLRYESRISVSDQIIEVSNVLVQLVNKLARNPHVPFVTVTSVNGNHDRVFACKDDNLPQDNFTRLINNNLRRDLRDNDKVVYLDNTVNHDEIAILDIKGKTFVAVHGDKVSKANCKQQLENILGIDIDYILMGHWHEPNQIQIHNTKVFINGSVVGTDSYASQKKLYTKPCQKLLFLDDYGICAYDIELDN